jgi:cyclic pyranopterin phosphate synthase
MRCFYCRPFGVRTAAPRNPRLGPLEWQRLAEALAARGVHRVRLTGGEPLLTPDVLEIVERIADTAPVDLAMTTNGSELERFAPRLARAGLRRVNISVDSLRGVRFEQITGGGRLEDTLRGLEAALDAGFAEIKLNTVVLRGLNDDELEDIVDYAWQRGLTPRFLELMGVGAARALLPRHAMTSDEVRMRLGQRLGLQRPVAEPHRGPARYVASRDGARRVGFVSAMSDCFCETCDRLRVSSDGALRACLALPSAVALGDALRSEGAFDAVGRALDRVWRLKPGPAWRGSRECTAAFVSMGALGG